MHRLLACLLPWLLLAPAAFAQQMLEDYDEAMRVFLGGASGPAAYMTDQHKAIANGLDGTWIILTTVAPKASDLDEAVFDKVCEKGFVAIETRGDAAFRMTRWKGTGQEVVYDYTLISGSTFAEHVDPDAYLRRLGVSLTDEKTRGPALSALSRRNLPLTFYRFAPDILVAVPLLGQPEIYGRCP